MTIYTDGPSFRPQGTIQQLWADNLTENVSLVSGAAKVVAVCVAVSFLAWMVARLFSPKGGRLGKIISLWLRAKEHELSARAGDTPKPPGM